MTQGMHPQEPIVADRIRVSAIWMSDTVPDVGVPVPVHLAEDIAVARGLEFVAGAARVLRPVLAAVNEVPFVARRRRPLLQLGTESVVAAIANHASDQVLMRRAEPADVSRA